MLRAAGLFDCPPTMTDTPKDVTSGHADPALPDNRPAEENDPELSPSVRRLVRQYNIDVASVQGSGPDGKLRPGDILAIVGNPALTQHPPSTNEAGALKGNSDAAIRSASISKNQEPAAITAATATTVFNCNISRVLAHRRRRGHEHVSIACYVANAALKSLARLAVLDKTQSLDSTRLVLVGESATQAATVKASEKPAPDSIQAALQTGALPKGGLTIWHHGLPGNVLDIRPPLERSELAVLAVGGIQRTIGLGSTDGNESPRVIFQSQLSLSFRPELIDGASAARFMADCVRRLESWHVPPKPGAVD